MKSSIQPMEDKGGNYKEENCLPPETMSNILSSIDTIVSFEHDRQGRLKYDKAGELKESRLDISKYNLSECVSECASYFNSMAQFTPNRHNLALSIALPLLDKLPSGRLEELFKDSFFKEHSSENYWFNEKQESRNCKDQGYVRVGDLFINRNGGESKRDTSYITVFLQVQRDDEHGPTKEMGKGNVYLAIAETARGPSSENWSNIDGALILDNGKGEYNGLVYQLPFENRSRMLASLESVKQRLVERFSSDYLPSLTPARMMRIIEGKEDVAGKEKKELTSYSPLRPVPAF